MSKLILLDYDIVLNHNISSLRYINLEKYPSNIYTGLVLDIQDDCFKQLEKETDRFSFIKTDKFQKCIITYFFISYNPKKKICMIFLDNDTSYIKRCLDLLLMELPADTTLLIRKKISELSNDTLYEYVKNGFDSPVFDDTKSFLYLSKKNNLGQSLECNKEKCIQSNKSVIKNIYRLLNYTDTQTISYKLSDNCKYFLKDLSKRGVSLNNDGKLTQKEISGSLSIEKIDDNLVNYMGIDTKTIFYGEEETVDVVNSMYSFHSHPKNAYDNHNTKFGYPSKPDIIGFLTVKQSIFHIVVCLEGYYVISIDKYWIDKKDKLIKFVRENVSEINHSNFSNPDDFVGYMNNIKFYNRKCFNIMFFEWNNQNDIFSIEL